MTHLHLFDLDGTLLHGTAAPVEISPQLGLGQEVATLERDFVTRRIDARGYPQRVHGLWSGLTEAHVDAASAGAPWLRRIRDTWAEIRGRGGVLRRHLALALVLRRAAHNLGRARGIRFAFPLCALH